MKLGMTGQIAKATLFAAALLLAGLSGSQANAQAGIQWKFALANEVHWGQTTLPPGDYVLTFEHVTMRQPTTVVIRDAKNLRVVAIELVGIREDSNKGTSALVIGSRGKHQIVESLRIAELGETFVYERPVQRDGSKEAHQTQAIPVIVAKR
jgi:hypothetical protein